MSSPYLPEGGEEAHGRSLSPTVARLLGVAEGEIDGDDYREHLLERYGF